MLIGYILYISDKRKLRLRLLLDRDVYVSDNEELHRGSGIY